MTDTLNPTTSHPAAPWFGRPREHRQAAIAGVGSVAASTVYWQGTHWFAPELIPGTVEYLATATSLWSVWITQRRNILAMPVGLVSVVLMGWFFSDIDLIGQTVLQWGYYIPVQVWAWREWTRGGEGHTELVVTRLGRRGALAVLGTGLVSTFVLGRLLDAGWERALDTYWDASIVAASVLAMALLSRKKVETWWLWIGPVNISAIVLYLRTGAEMFAALYCLYLVMAVFGLVRWRRAAATRAP